MGTFGANSAEGNVNCVRVRSGGGYGQDDHDKKFLCTARENVRSLAPTVKQVIPPNTEKREAVSCRKNVL